MYKVLIVDDESRQLTALANIIKKLRPEYEIFTAEDGYEALNILGIQSMDILITDIKMPRMDGLELLEKLGDKRRQLKIGIISGFTEFAYAQKAIAFGVNDYIVKPVVKTDIEKLLNVMVDSIRLERSKQQNDEILQKQLQNSLPVYIEHQLNKWIIGKADEIAVEEISTLFPRKGCGAVLVTEIKGINQSLVSEEGELKQEIKYRTKKALDDIGHSISFFVEGKPETMVTILSAEASFCFKSSENEYKLNGYIAELKDQLDLIVSIGISEKSKDIFAEVAMRFSQAQQALGRRFYQPSEKILHYDGGGAGSLLLTWDYEGIEKALSEAILRLDKTLCYQLIRSTMEELNGVYEQNTIKESVKLLLLHLSKALRHALSGEDYHSFNEYVKTSIEECQDYQGLWHSVNRILVKIIDHLDVQRKDINAVIIQKCKKYIEENYNKEMTLESIAQNYHFSSAYFGNLFKEYTQQSFSKYLTTFRLLKAQKLLVETDKTISDIALQIGIMDAAYFNRIFKREFGIAPNKYRQMRMRKQENS